MVIGYCGQTFEPAPYPEAVVGVTAKMVARAYESASTAPLGVDQATVGQVSYRRSAGAALDSLWLSATDKLALRSHRLGGGMTSVQLVGERYTITPTV